MLFICVIILFLPISSPMGLEWRDQSFPSDPLPNPAEGGGPSPQLQHQCPCPAPAHHRPTHPACASRAPPLLQAHLPGVVETFGLNVISLLIHHLHLGVQVPAQVLGEARFMGQQRKRGERSLLDPSVPFLPPCTAPLQDLHSGKESMHPFPLRFMAANSSLLEPFVFLSECQCVL